MKKLKELLDNYKLVVTLLHPEDGQGFIARFEELGLSVRGIGETQSEAIENLYDLALDGLADEDITTLPAPLGETPWADYSGRITLRLPKVLHAKVARQADEQGVSLNQWICHILESAATAVDAGCEFGARSDGETNMLKELLAVRETLDQWSTALSAQSQPYGPLRKPPSPKRSPLKYSNLEPLACA